MHDGGRFVASAGPLLLTLAATVLVGGIAYYLVQTVARRRAETAAGIALLAGMRWRDFAHLTLEALRREGYVEASVERQPGDSDFDFMLSHNGERWLLSCKHGTHYRLGEQTVRELATAIRMQGAQGGIIATLGRSDGFAGEIAQTHSIRLLDGKRLWPMVSELIPVEARADIAAVTERKVAHNLIIAGIGVVALAIGLFAVMGNPGGQGAAELRTVAKAVRAPPNATPKQDPESAKPLPKLSEAEREARRELAAQRVATLDSVNSAAWSTRSTLVIALNRPLSESTSDPISRACAILIEFEELRYSRLQIEPPPGDDTPVRWRQCN